MLLSLALIASLATIVQAQLQTAPTFVGCYSSTGGPYVAGRISAAQCTTACSTNSIYTYAFYRPGGGTIDCLCFTSAPNYALATLSSSSDNTVCASSTDYSVYRLRTTYVFDNCYTTVDLGSGGDQTFTAATSLDTIYNACRASYGVFYTVTTGGYQYVCLAADATFSNPDVCGSTTSFFHDTHSFAAASAMANRRRRLRVNEVPEYCPEGMQACNVQGSNEGYECLDTSSELESCGGCIHGVHGSDQQDEVGINCANLNGGEGRMTCKLGKCLSAFS